MTRAPPPPTPGRDIAGEESGAGSGGSHAYPGPGRRRESRDHYSEARDPYDSTDDRDNRDSDSGGETRYPGRRHRHGSPGARSGHHRTAARLQERSYRSSTDREDDRRYPGGGRREEERRSSRRQGERDHRSYYDRRRDEDRRRREEEEDDRRSNRGGDRSRGYIKREPRDWEDDAVDRYR